MLQSVLRHVTFYVEKRGNTWQIYIIPVAVPIDSIDKKKQGEKSFFVVGLLVL